MAHKKKSKEFKSHDLNVQFMVALLLITLSCYSISFFFSSLTSLFFFIVIEVKDSNIIVVVSVLSVILSIGIKMDEIK